MNELFDVYVDEVKEHLAIMNQSLVELEKGTFDKELLNKIFRAAHTIKGSSSMMGFNIMADFTHKLEDILSDVREGKLELNKKIIDLFFVCCDFLEDNIESIINNGKEEGSKSDELLKKLHLVVQEKHSKLTPSTSENNKKTVEVKDFDISDEDIRNIKDSIMSGYNVVNICVSISSECAMKSLRAWLIFRSIKEHVRILKSIPEEPSDEDLQNENFAFDSSEIKILGETEKARDSILELLQGQVEVINANVDYIEIDENNSLDARIKLISNFSKASSKEDKTDMDIIVDDIIGQSENEIVIEHEFTQDFVSAALEQIQKINENLKLFEKNKDIEVKNIYFSFRSFNAIGTLARFIEFDLVEKLSHKAEIILEDIRKEKVKLCEDNIVVVFKCAELIEKLCLNLNLINDSNIKIEAEKLLESKVDIISEEADEKSESKENEDKLSLLDTVPLKELEIVKSEESQNNMKSISIEDKKTNINDQNDKKAARTNSDGGYIRVPTRKIDNLIDMLGELLIHQSLLEKESLGKLDQNDKCMALLNQMAKIIKDVQKDSMSLRMVTMKSTFQKLMRIGRDTSMELQKEVELDFVGEDTELDRSVADKIFDPLMHLLRNAISHGIENSEERKSKNKIEKGQVIVRAYSKQGSIFIDVEDDGRGLSPEKLIKKAKEKGLIDSDAVLTDEEAYRLIFMPGFSTQEKVNSIAGRGVGMNVVETEVVNLGGRVDIKNKLGLGCTFTLKIPINLAVMNGTIVDIFGSQYIVPTLYIKQILKPEESNWVSIKGQRSMLKLRDNIIEKIDLTRVFECSNETVRDDEAMIIILEYDQKLKALPVRAVLERQEIVVKPLGEEFKNLDIVAGASILGDGKVSLIINIETLFKEKN
ncbi:chemotaxis protein CheA [Clostridium sp.]|uniref:chemotaxis protein CheA n=1 Tax=Clostridium sp. TaxID=1506 RepID=UPI002618C4CA|nr:chemotaxis protein CheA [Clostridium sp.]